jgi:hypothetical protein
MAIDLGKMRWMMFEQAGSFISMPLLAVLVFWLVIIFSSFGLFAPRNATAIATLFVCALSVSGAIFLILGDVHAIRGSDADLQCSTAQRPCTSRPVAGETLQAVPKHRIDSAN